MTHKAEKETTLNNLDHNIALFYQQQNDLEHVASFCFQRKPYPKML